MMYLSSHISWYIFLGLSAIAVTIWRYGNHSRGILSRRVENAGAWFILIIIGTCFYFTGFWGGLALIVSYWILKRAADLILWRVFRKLISAPRMGWKEFQERSQDYRKRIDVLNLQCVEQWSRKRDTEIINAARQPKVAELLRQQGKTEAELTDIQDTLIKAGAGSRVARSVIRNPSALIDYWAMKKSEFTVEAIAFKFLKDFGGF